MRAAVALRYGPPEVVQLADVERPSVEDDELLIRVRATTVNRTDCGYRAAKPFILRFFTGLVRPTTTVLGTEFAGEVNAIGDAVTSFAVGDMVFGYVEGTFGAHAEYMTVPAAGSVARIPSNSNFDEAAPSVEGAHYALAFIRTARIHRGQNVLVNGATGAIGSAAVQLLKSAGARVTAVCDSENLTMVKRLGADRVVDYTAEDFTKDEERYDAVFDAVGKASFRRCRRLLKPRGVYLSSELGRRCQNPLLALVTPLFGRRRVASPFPHHDGAMVRSLAQLSESGRYRPIIDRRYPLNEIVDAYRYVETGRKVGNVVITIP